MARGLSGFVVAAMSAIAARILRRELRNLVRVENTGLIAMKVLSEQGWLDIPPGEAVTVVGPPTRFTSIHVAV